MTRLNYRLWQTVHRRSPWCVAELQDHKQRSERPKTSGCFNGTEPSPNWILCLYCTADQAADDQAADDQNSTIPTPFMAHGRDERSKTVKLLTARNGCFAICNHEYKCYQFVGDSETLRDFLMNFQPTCLHQWLFSVTCNTCTSLDLPWGPQRAKNPRLTCEWTGTDGSRWLTTEWPAAVQHDSTLTWGAFLCLFC